MFMPHSTLLVNVVFCFFTEIHSFNLFYVVFLNTDVSIHAFILLSLITLIFDWILMMTLDYFDFLCIIPKIGKSSYSKRSQHQVSSALIFSRFIMISH